MLNQGRSVVLRSGFQLGKPETLKHKDRLSGWMFINAGSADALGTLAAQRGGHSCPRKSQNFVCVGKCYNRPSPIRTFPYLLLLLASRLITRVESQDDSAGAGWEVLEAVAVAERRKEITHQEKNSRISQQLLGQISQQLLEGAMTSLEFKV